MKVILILSALLTVAVAQQPVGLSCNYFFSFDTYRCELTIYNPNGLDDFTEIGGIHLEGFSNADVTYIYRTAGFSPNIPSIICNAFPNLSRVMFYNTGLSQITDSSFAGCSEITELDLALNQINSITPNAFATLDELRYLYLEANNIQTVPENLLANQQELILFDLNYNPFATIPVNLFRPAINLETVFLGYAALEEFNNQWFTANTRLSYLYLSGNSIELTADTFTGLGQLNYLNLARNGLNDIPAGTFAPLQNLEFLYLYGNDFTVLEENFFTNLSNVEYLDISENPTIAISDGAFRGLTSLTSLSIASCRLRQLSPGSFEGLESLNSLQMNFNEIEELPPGVFATIENVSYIGLWNNRIKTLRRNIFGNLENLETVDLDGNVVNALDRDIIDDAVRLNTLYFNGNLCANNYFGNFLISRNQYLVLLQRCFDNMRFIIDTTTEPDGQYSFFDGPQPGIFVRVNTDNEVQIALTPFNFEWDPMLEVLLGTSNNTRSVIRMNGDTNVVTVPTPNIIALDRWNDFRITWANQVVLVFRGNEAFPFMAFTMREFFPVGFYGLRAVETSAMWSVQPVDPPQEESQSPIQPPTGPATEERVQVLA